MRLRLLHIRNLECPGRFFGSITGTVEKIRDIKTLVVSNFFPDPSASAAGARTQALLEGLSQMSLVHLVTSVPPPAKTQPSSQAVAADPYDIIEILERQNISWSCLPPNRSQQTKEFCPQFPKVSTILFDRFYVEEAYSFAFKEYYPESALILDMQDMHSLRRGREKLVKEWDVSHSGDPFLVLEQVMTHTPCADDPLFMRELASIHRSDLTLVCSSHELKLLQSMYAISASKLCLAPFFVPLDHLRQPDFKTTSPQTFLFCGGFRHSPNVDAVRILLRFVWPRIREALPTATLHIHGAYCPSEFRERHNPSRTGVHIHGYTPSLHDVFSQQGCILLAPLRFGAGIKGKIIDAWTYGVPVVTTPVGSEGLILHTEGTKSSFGGGVAWTVDEFVEMAVELAISSNFRHRAITCGQEILRRKQDRSSNWGYVQSAISSTQWNLLKRRQEDYTRALLWHQSARSTEYFSKWIELKESQLENLSS
jgi:hypothetical protein